VFSDLDDTEVVRLGEMCDSAGWSRQYLGAMTRFVTEFIPAVVEGLRSMGIKSFMATRRYFEQKDLLRGDADLPDEELRKYLYLPGDPGKPAGIVTPRDDNSLGLRMYELCLRLGG